MTTQDQIIYEWQFQKQKWGLSGWKIKFSNRKRNLGHCNCTKKVISISNAFLKTNSYPVMKDTLLHEIAHAFQYIQTGFSNHGREWQDIAKKVGCSSKRCTEKEDVNFPSGSYIGTCPECGKQTHFYREVRRVYSCNVCSKKFDPRFKLKIVPIIR